MKDINVSSMLSIFGIGYIGKWFINEIGYEKVNVIIDNNHNLWGKRWKNIEIISLKEYKERKYETQVVITSATYFEEIAIQLENNDIYDYEIYAKKWVEIFLFEKADGISSVHNKLFLMNTHSFRNIGDYAITYAEILLLKKWKYDVIIIPSCICKDGMEYLKKIISKSDTIIISGGGYLGNLWMNCGEDTVRSIIDNFSDNKIIIFPQSIYYTDDGEGEREKRYSAQIYAKASKLALFTREQRSYMVAREICKNSTFICPDIVLSLCDTYNNDEPCCKRDNVAICFRNDKEMIISDYKRETIIDDIKKICGRVDSISMELPENRVVNEFEGENEVKLIMEKLKGYKLVITDRLHCLLLCVVTKTPCLFLDNISKKISETYAKWLSEIKYIKEFDCENADSQIKEFMNMGNMTTETLSYISSYSQLHLEIEGDIQ